MASLRQNWGPRVIDTVKLIYEVQDDLVAPKPDMFKLLGILHALDAADAAL